MSAFTVRKVTESDIDALMVLQTNYQPNTPDQSWTRDMWLNHLQGERNGGLLGIGNDRICGCLLYREGHLPSYMDFRGLHLEMILSFGEAEQEMDQLNFLRKLSPDKPLLLSIQGGSPLQQSFIDDGFDLGSSAELLLFEPLKP